MRIEEDSAATEQPKSFKLPEDKFSGMRLIIANFILRQKGRFDANDIKAAMQGPWIVQISQIEVVLKDMVESGFAYQDGFKYVTRSIEERWHSYVSDAKESVKSDKKPTGPPRNDLIKTPAIAEFYALVCDDDHYTSADVAFVDAILDLEEKASRFTPMLTNQLDVCPKCSATVYRSKFCPHCGQAILYKVGGLK